MIRERHESIHAPWIAGFSLDWGCFRPLCWTRSLPAFRGRGVPKDLLVRRWMGLDLLAGPGRLSGLWDSRLHQDGKSWA